MRCREPYVNQNQKYNEPTALEGHGSAGAAACNEGARLASGMRPEQCC